MKRELVLAGAAALLAVTWVLALPTCWTIFDEQAYLTQALRFARGEPFPAAPQIGGLALPGPRMVVDAFGYERPEFAAGWPALLAPFAARGVTTAFALTLIVHLLGTAAFVGVLRRLDLDPRWALLYLLHPTAVLFARTAMADVPAMAVTAAGLFFWVDRTRSGRSAALAGLVWGLSLHVRWSQGALLAGFLVSALLIDRMRGTRRSAALAAGLAPGILTAVAASLWMHGSVLPPRSMGFGAEHLAANLPVYALWLALLYPGLLFVPLRRGAPLRTEAGLTLLVSLLLFGAFSHRYVGFGPAAPVIGLRFFLPATVLLLPAYAAVLEEARARLPAAVPWVAGVLLFALGAGLQIRHADAQRAQLERVDAVTTALSHDPVIAMNDARELLLEPPGPVIRWLPGDPLPAIDGPAWILLSVRGDRAEGADAAASLEDQARSRWTLEIVVDVPPEGGAPGVRLLRAR